MPWTHALPALQAAGINTPALDAQLLLAHVLGCTREHLLMAPPTLTPAQQAQFEALLARRARREPLSHLRGIREFYGREFIVTKHVLDPRPDSETLIETTLRITPHGPPLTILDIGTGSGCLLLTLLAELPYANGIGVDISAEALVIASQNADRLGLHTRVRWMCMDMGVLRLPEPCGLIVSNPPYIPTAEIAHLMPEVSQCEPTLALDGGKDGLDCYRKLAKQVSGLLAPGGALVLEIGSTQADDVSAIMHASSTRLCPLQVDTAIPDLGGHARCLVIRHLTST